jgi:hypothetical protein
MGFLSGLPERVILDEVQRVPEVFRTIKRSVDAKRQPGRFPLTGSAQALRVELQDVFPSRPKGAREA